MSEQSWRERAELAEQENYRLTAAVEDLRERLDKMRANAERLDRARAHAMVHLRVAAGLSMRDLVDLIERAGGTT